MLKLDVGHSNNDIILSLSALLASTHDALAKEQHFSADAAHELRTPLAACKTLAQLALRAENKDNLHDYLQDIVTGLNRAQRIIDQLRVLNGAHPESVLNERKDVNIYALIASLSKELCLISHKNPVIINEVPQSFHLFVNEPCFQILFRNLIDNAIRYSNAHPRVTVSAEQKGDNLYIAVTDNGPGIPMAMRAQVMERFYRGADADEPGCGLGLSIAARICTLHGGEISLHEGFNQEGLRVLIRIPIIRP